MPAEEAALRQVGGGPIIDAHCHLSFKGFNRDRAEVVGRAGEVLEAVVDCGATAGTIRRSLALSAEHPGFVHTSLGLHPYRAGRMDAAGVEDVLDLVVENADRAVALGETGLEFHHTGDAGQRRRQGEVFMRFVEMARELDMPLVVHARDAEEKALEMARAGGAEKVLFHCFGGSLETARAVLDAGYNLSFATNLCYSEHHQSVLASIGLEGVCLETDSPYLSPRRDCKRNEPSFIFELVDAVAGITGLSREEVEGAAAGNAKEFYGLG
ncbi:MAG: TatD family hydrolase [Euryarchaeota archaeon]|nr:TatD family hydrolase [Euryarchaeota archaeon]